MCRLLSNTSSRFCFSSCFLWDYTHYTEGLFLLSRAFSCLFKVDFCPSLFFPCSLDFPSSSSHIFLLFWECFFPFSSSCTSLACHPPLQRQVPAYQSLSFSPFRHLLTPRCCTSAVRWSGLGGNKLQTDLSRCSIGDLLCLGSFSAAAEHQALCLMAQRVGSVVVPRGVITRGWRAWVLISLQSKSPFAQLPAASAAVTNGFGAWEIPSFIHSNSITLRSWSSPGAR